MKVIGLGGRRITGGLFIYLFMFLRQVWLLVFILSTKKMNWEQINTSPIDMENLYLQLHIYTSSSYGATLSFIWSHGYGHLTM